MTSQTTSQKIIRKLYAAGVGAAATIGAQKLMALAWKFVTGPKPPRHGEQDMSTRLAITWALASGVGMGMSKLVANRFVIRG